MEFLPVFLLRIFTGAFRREESSGRGLLYIIIRQPFAHLEERFRRVFEGQEDVKVIVDRRYRERRRGAHPVAPERRQADRRGAKDEVGEVVVLERLSGPGAAGPSLLT